MGSADLRLGETKISSQSSVSSAMVNPNANHEQGLGCGFRSKLLQGEERSVCVGLLNDYFASDLW